MGESKRRLGKDFKENRRVLDQFHQTCAICADAPKTASLVFEKVIAPIELIGDGPIDLVAYRSKGRVHSFPAMSGGGVLPAHRRASIKFREDGFAVVSSERENFLYLLQNNAGGFCESIQKTGYRPVLCYPKVDDSHAIFQPGDYNFLVSAISNLGVVDEEKITWEQVLEFRRDSEARALRGRFISWLNEEVSGKSVAEIQDRICYLYEQNNSVLKKFGIVMRYIGDEVFGMRTQNNKGRSPKGVATIGTLLAAVAVGAPTWVTLTLGGIVAGSAPVYAGFRRASVHFSKSSHATAYLHSLSAAIDAGDSLNSALTLEGPSEW